MSYHHNRGYNSGDWRYHDRHHQQHHDSNRRSQGDPQQNYGNHRSGSNNLPYPNQNNNRKRDAPYSSDSRAAKRSHLNTQHSRQNDRDLTCQEQHIKKAIQASGVCVDFMSRQAFQRPDGWDEKLQEVTNTTSSIVLAEIEKNEGNETGSFDSFNNDSDSDDAYSIIPSNNQTDQKMVRQEMVRQDITNFINKLQSCHQMMAGFHLDKDKRNEKTCVCPCSKKYGLKIDDLPYCDSTSFKPNGLMDHLKKIGGVYSDKTKNYGLQCKYHYAARIFLSEAYPEFHRGVGHKALYSNGEDQQIPHNNNLEPQTDVQEIQEVRGKNEDLESQMKELSERNEKLSRSNEDLLKTKERLENTIKEKESLHKKNNEQSVEQYSKLMETFKCEIMEKERELENDFKKLKEEAGGAERAILQELSRQGGATSCKTHMEHIEEVKKHCEKNLKILREMNEEHRESLKSKQEDESIGLEDKNEALRDLKKNLERERGKLHEITMKSQETINENYIKNIRDLENKMGDLSDENDKLQKSIKVAEGVKVDFGRLTNENELSRTELNRVKRDLNKVEQERNALNKDYEELQSKVETMKKELESQKKGNEDMVKKCDEMNIINKNCHAKIEELKSSQQGYDNLKAEYKNLESQMKVLNAKDTEPSQSNCAHFETVDGEQGETRSESNVCFSPPVGGSDGELSEGEFLPPSQEKEIDDDELYGGGQSTNDEDAKVAEQPVRQSRLQQVKMTVTESGPSNSGRSTIHANRSPKSATKIPVEKKAKKKTGPTSKRTNYSRGEDNSRLWQAVQHYMKTRRNKNKPSLEAVGQKFGIPRTTLHHFVHSDKNKRRKVRCQVGP